MRLPDYDGNSIVNLMASLQVGCGGGSHAYPFLNQLPQDRVRQYRRILLWVIDGLGYHYLRAHPEAGHLNAALQDRMTTVYPPTTASAITTFLTGEAPQQHGLTGWFIYFRELGSVISVLPGRSRYGGPGYRACGIDAGALLEHTPFADRLTIDTYNILPDDIAGSDFSLAHQGRANLKRYRNLMEMLSRTVDVLRSRGDKYVYLYWPELDSIGHHAGIQSEEARRHLLELDTAFASLLDQARGTDTLIIVCADHGLIDTTPEETVKLEEHPELADMLILPLCGEPRSAYCYLRPGSEQAFDDYIKSEMADRAEAYETAQVIEENWFGLGTPHPRLRERIGDRVLLMRDNTIIRDCLAQEKRFQMIGVHGGLSDEELDVPLILAEV